MIEHSTAEVFENLVRLQTLLWNKVDAAVRADGGVGLGSVDVLRVASTTPECRVNDIAAALAITVGGASQAVDRLVAKGLVTRRPHAQDRRSSVVELTPDGQSRLLTAQAVIDAQLAVSLRQPLPEDRFRQ